MNAEEYWERFTDYNYEYEDAKHTVWAFCGGGKPADRLLALVLAKIKTATAGLYDSYIAEGDTVPEPGDCSVVLDSKGVPTCVIVTQKVTVVPFKEVTAEHAFKEGEGDQSLEYWRKVHEEFFRKECAEIGIEFTEDIKVVCEEFELIFQ